MITPLSAAGWDPADHARAGTQRPRGSRSRAGRWALALLAACVALMAFGPLSGAQAAGTASITGEVTALKGGAGLVGIEVTASGPEFAAGTTGAGGKYKLENLTAGRYTVSFFDPTQKFIELEESVVLTEGKVETLSPKLKENGAISGRVTSAATGAGLANVTVSAVGSLGGEVGFTNANGEYTIEHLAAGQYSVTFSQGAFLPQNTIAEVSEGETTGNVNAALKEGGKISGVVTDTVTHTGLAKIGVSASSLSGFGFASTNANGEYTITNLPAGSYKVRFEWEFSEAEGKEFEAAHAPRFIPKYITQYFSGQLSESTANPLAIADETLTAGVNAAMVRSVPVNIALPVVSGAPTAGTALSCSSGSWTGEPELKLAAGWPLTSPFAYQWLRDGVAIPGAASDTYVLQAADIGHGFICEVTATNGAGSAMARSSSFVVVKPVPVVTISASKFKFKKGATKVSLACANAACAGSVTAVEKFPAKHHKKQTIVIASGSYSLAAGKTGTITLRLTAAGKKKLAQASHHGLSPKLVVSVAGGKQLEKAAQFSLGR